MTVTPPSYYKDFVGNVAVVTTILQFLSGILVCKQYVLNKSTADASPLPFICGAVSTSLWLLYGASKHDNKIVFVNAVGVILMVSYVVVFLKYSYKKLSLIKQILGCVVFGFFLYGYMSIEDDNERLLFILGLLASSLTLVTVAAPLSKLFHVMKVKNTECLPFPMILMSFFVSLLWLLYGYLDADIFILLPNFIGVGLAVSQLWLFVIYPSMPKSPGIAKTMLA